MREFEVRRWFVRHWTFVVRFVLIVYPQLSVQSLFADVLLHTFGENFLIGRFARTASRISVAEIF